MAAKTQSECQRDYKAALTSIRIRYSMQGGLSIGGILLAGIGVATGGIGALVAGSLILLGAGSAYSSAQAAQVEAKQAQADFEKCMQNAPQA